MSQNDRLNSLQLARFVAAFGVVLFHGFRIGDQRLEIFNGLNFGVGRAGVDIFFVISGFIMAYTTYGRNESAGNFALRRLFRIVPLYWIFTALVFAVAVAAPSLLGASTAEPLDLIRSLFFIPYAKENGLIQPLLYVGWTINYEMFFYALFALSILVAGARAPLLASAILVTLFLAGLALPDGSVPWRFYTDGVILEFIFGMGLHWFYRRNPSGFGKYWWVCLVGFGLLLVQLVYPIDWPRQFMYGVPAILVVGGLVGLTIRRSWLTLLGDASYSMYLAHPYVLTAVAVLLLRLHLPFPLTLASYIILSVIGVVVTSLAAYWLIERPSNEAGRAWMRSGRKRAA